jgi:integrase
MVMKNHVFKWGREVGPAMTRPIHKLSARTVATASKPSRYSDGGGLYLAVSKDRKRWVFRFVKDGRIREMGLGPASTVSLAEARKKAARARHEVADGNDPIECRKAASKAPAGRQTFSQCAEALIAAKRSEWRSKVHAGQWRTTLETYCTQLWDMPVDEIDTAAVLSVLTPLWARVPETASRVRGRIENVLDAAHAHGLIPQTLANPARWKGHLAHLLPKRGKLTRGHYPAIQYSEIPDFLARLREHESIAVFALEFTILTAARSGEVLGARWSEIDLTTKVWEIPAHRMKAGVAHRVPLCDRALSILEQLSQLGTNDFVFPGRRYGQPLSHSALEITLRKVNGGGASVHGMRSAFRDWAGNETNFPRELAEGALAHRTGDAVEQAYRRGDALEKRRQLMAAWDGFCATTPGDNVVKFSGVTRA